MTPGKLWLACLALIALMVGMREPVLFLYELAIAGLLLIAALYLALVAERSHSADLEAEIERTEREKDGDIADLSAALAEATATLADARVVRPLRPVVVERPDLHIAPPFPQQRAGEHDRLALSTEEWDAITRETEGPA